MARQPFSFGIREYRHGDAPAMARLYHRSVRELGPRRYTQEQVAQKVGKNRATVSNMLRLLKLPPRIQASLRDGTITIGHARALISIEDEALQVGLVKEIEERDLSVRDVEERVRDLHRPDAAPEAPASESPTPADPAPALPRRDQLQLQDYTTRLRSMLSTQVAIKHKGDGGKIEIAYYSDEDLERLMDMLLRM